MTLQPDTLDVFAHTLKAHAEGLAEDATSDDVRRRTFAARWIGTMKYDNERATRHSDRRSPDEETLYQLAHTTLPVANAFIETADDEQLRHVLEGMVHGLNIDNLLRNPSPLDASDPEEASVSAEDVAVFRTEPPSLSYVSTLFLADLASAFKQTSDTDARHRSSVALGTLKHANEQSLRNRHYPIAEQTYLATEATRALATIDELIAGADAGQLRGMIAGFAASTRDQRRPPIDQVLNFMSHE